MKVLSVEQLIELHVLVIRQTGGSEGLRDLGRLESAIATQTQTAFGKELYVTLFEKAAVFIRNIIGDHPFMDGNKRTAMLAGLTFLSINGMIYGAQSGELEDFAVKVAVDRLSVEEITAWLEEHCTEDFDRKGT
ncbi:MAG TPA: type II toxin-antitoxin system death-on-curing family toxin [Candidatus Saccharimonadales bacterium]